ncbi:hypothetical protein GVX82_03740 [Patescibacteria group bacterium]|jgi:hypothetical protein|nr:hypothetical protein [Patescibacteria group bacterium]
MSVFESRLGNIFVIIYSVLSVVIAAVSFFCGTLACATFSIVPLLPWIVLWGTYAGVPAPMGMYPILFLLNVVIVYSMGVAVDTLVDAKRSR